MTFVHLHRHKYTPKGVSRYEVDSITNCWYWQLSIVHGYGYSSALGGRAHRWFYKQFIDPDILPTIALHHECENKRCVNPWHLKPVTFAEHNIIHQLGKKMNLSDEERNRRSLHGKIHSINFQKSYTKRTRSEVALEQWSNRLILTNEQVVEIKEMLDNKYTYKQISDKFNIAVGTVGNIRHGRGCYAQVVMPS